MRMSTSSSMIFAAIALSSTTLGAPLDSIDAHSTASTEPNVAESSFQAEGVSLDSMLNPIPVAGSMFSPVASMLDSTGSSDPARLANKAPLNDAQKAAFKKLQEAISAAASKVGANAPVKPREEESFQAEGMDLRSTLGSLPLVGNAFMPVASFLDSVGLSKVTDNVPLSAFQQGMLAKLQGALSTAASGIAANLPIRREEGFEEEDYHPLEARDDPRLDTIISAIPILGSILSPVTALLVANGLNDPRKMSGKIPLTPVQRMVLSKLRKAISEATEKVGRRRASLP